MLMTSWPILQWVSKVVQMTQSSVQEVPFLKLSKKMIQVSKKKRSLHLKSCHQGSFLRLSKKKRKHRSLLRRKRKTRKKRERKKKSRKKNWRKNKKRKRFYRIRRTQISYRDKLICWKTSWTMTNRPRKKMNLITSILRILRKVYQP